MTTRERRILVATAVLAVGVPVVAVLLVRASTDSLAAHLTRASGVSASIGSVDADLTGTVRLSNVGFGSLISAETIEASVALDSLLSGDLRADEIQIGSPRVSIEVDADGDSNLARLARRLAKRSPSSSKSTSSRPSNAHASPRIRRIVVSEGTLTARIAGVGEISADGVEIVPDAGGVRVITGPLRVSTHGGPLPALANIDVDLSFARSAAELSMPAMKFGRVLAVGGTGSITAGGKTTVLRDVAAGRLGKTSTPDARIGDIASNSTASNATPSNYSMTPSNSTASNSMTPSNRGASSENAPQRPEEPKGVFGNLSRTSERITISTDDRDGPKQGSSLGPLGLWGASSGVSPPMSSATHHAPLASASPIEIRATIDDAGVPREIAVEATPTLLILNGNRVPLAGLAAIAPKSARLDNAHASGTLRIAREPGGLAIEADGSIEGLVLDHRTLAEVPIPIAAAVRATARVASDALTLERFELDMGTIHMRASGNVHRSANAPMSAQIDLAIDKARCSDLLASLPAELHGPLDGIVLDGEIGLASKLTIDLAAPVGDGAALTADFAGRCKTLSEPPAADVTTLRRDDDESDDDFVAIDKIPGRVRGAFVSAEDGRFWDHDGFDLQQIGRSLEIDLRERRLARGGSTISQQLIKNSFLTHRRTLDRKIQEAVLTWRLEARLDKQQILERYLNVIELGPGVRGIGAAAKHWFGTTPRGLTIRQAAFLAAITSEPTSMSRRVRRHGGLDEVSGERVATILRAMRRDGVISSAEHDAARAQSMNFAPAAIRDDR